MSLQLCGARRQLTWQYPANSLAPGRNLDAEPKGAASVEASARNRKCAHLNTNQREIVNGGPPHVLLGSLRIDVKTNA